MSWARASMATACPADRDLAAMQAEVQWLFPGFKDEDVARSTETPSQILSIGQVEKLRDSRASGVDRSWHGRIAALRDAPCSSMDGAAEAVNASVLAAVKKAMAAARERPAGVD